MLRTTGVGILALLLVVSAGMASAEEKARVTSDVIYGHKDGMALVMHVYQPPQPNGAGVIQIVSGGYFSGWVPAEPRTGAVQPFLKPGYTVFTVFHGSNPRYTLVDAVDDMRRAVRFIRANASQYGVDPNRLGAVGGSAGGHLSLMLATTGEDGDSSASDPLLRAGSRIAAAVAIAPPVDFQEPDKLLPRALERGGTDQAGADRLKPALNFDASLGPSVSPVLHVTPDDAATLLIHGDVDLLVPIDNSRRIYAEFQDKHVPSELIVLAGVGHGTAQTPAGVQELGKSIARAVTWFDKYLAKK